MDKSLSNETILQYSDTTNAQNGTRQCCGQINTSLNREAKQKSAPPKYLVLTINANVPNPTGRPSPKTSRI